MTRKPIYTTNGFGRRGFLQVAGFGVVGISATSLLAACGSDGSGGKPSGNAATATFDPSTELGADSVKKFLSWDKLDEKTLGTGKTMEMTAQFCMTGPFAYYGSVFKNGMELGIKHIKEMGGPDIKVDIKDNKSFDPQVSISTLREVQASGQQFFITSGGGSFGAIIPTRAAADAPVAFNTALAYGVPPQLGAKNYWEPDGDISLCMPFMCEYLANAMPDKKRLVLVNSDQGAEANKVVLDNLKSSVQGDWEVVGSQDAPQNISDYSAVVAEVASANPDAVCTALGSGPFGQFVKAYRQAGITAPIIPYGPAPSIDDYKAVGGDMAGVIYVGPYFNLEDPGNPWAEWFLADYYVAYGKKPGLPDMYAANYYMNVFQWWQLWMKDWAKGVEPSAATVNAYMEASPEFLTIHGGDKTTPGTTVTNGDTHFAGMTQGVYEIQNDFTFKKIAQSDPDGSGYNAV
jgi:ABC-type branched-subunit amino acid transport system substrate-binding protein